MTAVTAKVVLQPKQPGTDHTRLVFVPDYADQSNKEWAFYTPNLDFQMVVRNEVADKFEDLGKYTVTFEKSEE